ncbi:S8 family serine peptidase [Riemerella columbina]|uniref:S8 family serine peptidase n=1 Tax=Riemerella columbina TaxID=103810 RepID=UPI0003675F7A|nr:S8 family serine peptidase [Riemerella columbina]
MRKTILEKLGKKQNLLPIAAGFLLFPSFAYAQNAEQVKKIKEASNLQQLQKLQHMFNKKTMTVSELQLKAKQNNIPFSGVTSKGKVFQLQGFDKKGKPLYYVTNNVGAAAGTETDKVGVGTYFNLEGSGMKVHEWDGGKVKTTHQEFDNRVVQKDSPLSFSAHATHVAGTMVASGVNPNSKGMAPKATLDAYDWNSDEQEMIAAADAGALVSNHSYGYLGGFEWGDWSGREGWHWFGTDDDTEYFGYGFYSEVDQDWDLIANNAPYYLPVKAAGNPRGDGPNPGEKHYVRNSNGDWVESTKVRQKNGGGDGFDCINTGSVGKNILVVGAAHKLNGYYKSPSDVKMASFSGFGPVNDGRIKPDLSGIGVGLFSSNSTGNDAYTSMSGTSMASPNVTGSLILLQELYSKKNNGNFMKSATLKALAIATAHEAGANDGPDYASGWGLLNTYGAAQAIALNEKYTLIKEKKLKNGEDSRLDVVASGTEPLKVTIAWTDPAPDSLPDDSVINDRKKMLVNDLDLRVLKNGSEEQPWVLDPENPNNAATKGDNTVDNVEQVLIKNPEAGATYTIIVKNKGQLKTNVVTTDANGKSQVTLVNTNTQDYSLVVTGVNNGVNKDLELVSSNVEVEAKDYSASTPVKFTVKNKGLADVSGAKLKYKLINKDNADQLVSEGEVDIPTLSSGSTQQINVNVDLSQSFVNFSLESEIIYAGDEVELNNKTSLSLFGTLANLKPDNASHSFGFEHDMNKYGWTSEDTDADGKTWRKYDDPQYAYEGGSFVTNFPGNKSDVNDWLFSNPLSLKKDVLYRVVFYARKFQDPKEFISISLGNEAKSTAMTKEIAPRVEATEDISYNKFFYEFKVDTDQVAFIGFNHKTEGTDKSYAFAMDNVKFEYAESKPQADFKASKTTPNTFETVEFKNTTVTASTLPISSWEWTFTPSTVTYQDGTNATSKDPKVVFNNEGKYTVSLKAVNNKGEDVATKTNYVTTKNTATKANFSVNKQEIFKGEAVVFTNTSTGNPKPESYKWTITPTDGVEYVGGTNDTSENPNVKFNNKGKYTVSLKATSLNNSDTKEEQDLITVSEIYNSVDNLTHELNVDKLKLKWDRPDLNAIYKESFEEDGKMPSTVTILDTNDDKKTWTITKSYANSGSYGVMNYSWYFTSYDSDDYLVTSKLRGGAEVLKYFVKYPYDERYDVYVVEAPASGNVPTVDEIKAGQKVYALEASDRKVKFTEMKLNIKEYAKKDFFIAFHHRTKKTDNSFYLALDDIEVGYDNSAAGKSATSVGLKVTSNEVNDFKADYINAEKLVSSHDLEKPSVTTNNKVTFGATNLPYLTGYQVVKDGTVVKDINDVAKRYYDETMTANGTYTYDVYAVYSDGVKSEKKTVVVNITNLSTKDVDANSGLKVYPNPSTGKFVVEAEAGVSSLKASVYDMSGKQILNNTFKGNKFELNLTQYSKGVYILNLVDNKGVKHNVKLMVK